MHSSTLETLDIIIKLYVFKLHAIPCQKVYHIGRTRGQWVARSSGSSPPGSWPQPAMLHHLRPGKLSGLTSCQAWQAVRPGKLSGLQATFTSSNNVLYAQTTLATYVPMTVPTKIFTTQQGHILIWKNFNQVFFKLI